MKTKKALVGLLLFVTILFIYYYIHITYLKVDVVFYSAILDGVLAAATTAIILIFVPYFKGFNSFEKMQMIIIFVLVPVISTILSNPGYQCLS